MLLSVIRWKFNTVNATGEPGNRNRKRHPQMSSRAKTAEGRLGPVSRIAGPGAPACRPAHRLRRGPPVLSAETTRGSFAVPACQLAGSPVPLYDPGRRPLACQWNLHNICTYRAPDLENRLYPASAEIVSVRLNGPSLFIRSGKVCSPGERRPGRSEGPHPCSRPAYRRPKNPGWAFATRGRPR